MRSVLRVLASGALLATALVRPAAATPPEGCVGIPSIPAAFVCITQWSPQNAVPSATTGTGPTITIPEFCVFLCVGPTPVTLPAVVITRGDGVVAVVQYNGQTYTVTVPPLPDVSAFENQVATQVSALVQTVIDTVNGVTSSDHGSVDMAGTASVGCYGCGSSSGTMSGTYASTVDGVPHSGSFTANFSTFESPSTCPLNGTATGTVSFSGWGSVSFNWTRTASLVVMTFQTPEGYDATVYATWQVATLGVPCGASNVSAAFSGTGRITTP